MYGPSGKAIQGDAKHQALRKPAICPLLIGPEYLVFGTTYTFYRVQRGSWQALLAGSWVVISRVTILITHIRGPITLLITTPEPPSRRTSSDKRPPGARDEEGGFKRQGLAVLKVARWRNHRFRVLGFRLRGKGFPSFGVSGLRFRGQWYFFAHATNRLLVPTVNSPDRNP